MSDDLSEAFKRTVEEGDKRLHRTWPELLVQVGEGAIEKERRAG